MRDDKEKVKVFVIDRKLLPRNGIDSAPWEEEIAPQDIEENEDVLSLIQVFSPDVVVLNTDRSSVNQSKLTHRIKERSPRVSVVVLADQRDEDVFLQAIKTGTRAYFSRGVAQRTPSEPGDKDSTPLSAGSTSPVVLALRHGWTQA